MPGKVALRYVQLAGLLLGSVWLVVWMGLPVGRLLEPGGWQYVVQTMKAFARPELSSAFVWRVLKLMVESLAIGVLGMLGAMLLAVPLALAAARLSPLPDPPVRSRFWSLCGAAIRAWPAASWSFFGRSLRWCGPFCSCGSLVWGLDLRSLPLR